MISGMKTIVFFLLGAFALVSSGSALAALTTDELTRLKTSGLGEDVILFMIENDYGNVDRVVRLKEAGFADGTISSVIRSDLKAGVEAKRPALQPQQPEQPEQVKQGKPVAEPVTKPMAEAAAIMQTSAKVTIEQYLALGDPVVQKSQDIPGATISLLQGRRLKIEWDGSKLTQTVGNLLLRGKPFASPFYWDLDKSDGVHSANPKDNSFILRTGHSHQGRPTAGKTQYWVVHVTPDSPDLEKRIRELLSE
ncbi:MAG: hypothetical protein K0M58_05710 [Thiobacillus sp.]|nr:hypothetical protein [Thiobacillus sp.]